MTRPCRLTVTVRVARDEHEVQAAQRLRTAVFCGEQGVDRAEELDGLDSDATHVVALDESGVIATCRLRMMNGEVKLERMAVGRHQRGHGVGSRLLDFAEQEAGRSGAQSVLIHAQTRVRDFYEHRGYLAEGGTFAEADIEHVAMRKRLHGSDG